MQVVVGIPIEAALLHTTTSLSLTNIICRLTRYPYRHPLQVPPQVPSIILKSILRIRKLIRSHTDLPIIIPSLTDPTHTRGQARLRRLCQNSCPCCPR